MNINETIEKYLTEEELDRQWDRLLLKHGFKEVSSDGKSTKYKKDKYFISVGFKSSPGINRWGARYNDKIHLYGGTSIKSLRDYISGKGKRSLGDAFDVKSIKNKS